MNFKHKIIELLSVRDHSAKELRSKLISSFKRKERAVFLKNKTFNGDDGASFESLEDTLLLQKIDEAIQWAKENKWLAEENVLSERNVQILHQKKKGHKFISQYLKMKGLPPVAKDLDKEIEKALLLVKKKLKDQPLEKNNKIKIIRFLTSRGYDLESIKKALEKYEVSFEEF